MAILACIFATVIYNAYLCICYSPANHYTALNIIDTYSQEARRLIRLGLPVLVAQVGVIFVTFADTMMVGRYSTAALASAAFVNSVFTVPTVMVIGFASGLTPLIGALFTQGANEQAGRTYRAALQLSVLVSLALMVCMGAFYFAIPHLGQPEHLVPLIQDYYIIVLVSLLTAPIFCASQQMANGVTDTAMPMWITLSTNVVNVAGNYILIFGHFGAPELGLVGAGLATLGARVLGAVAIVTLIMTRRRYSRYMPGLRSHAGGDTRRLVWRTSYPVSIQNGIECMLWSLGVVICGWFGHIELAAYQVIVTISQLGFMTYISFGVATSIRVANLNGLSDVPAMRRACHAGLAINLLLALMACIVFYAGGAHLLELFTEDMAVVEYAVALIPPLILYQFADAAQLTYANALRGTSHVKPLLWVSLIAYIAVGIPFMYWCGVTLDGQAVGIFYSFSVSLLLAALLLRHAWLRRLRWVTAHLQAAKE